MIFSSQTRYVTSKTNNLSEYTVIGNIEYIIKAGASMVYLVNLPFKSQDERVIQSLGMAYIAADLIANGIEPKIFDGCGVDRFSCIDGLLSELINNNPEYVGFYVVEHNFDETLEFIKRMKQVVNTKVFLGGPQVFFLAEQIIQHCSDIDFIIVGESEGKLSKIIAQDYSSNCLLYRENGEIKQTDSKCDNLELDYLEFPVRRLGKKCLLTRETYDQKDYYVVPISSSRGCPYQCAFCAVPAMVSSQRIKWRFRSAYNVCSEIQTIYQEFEDIYIRFIDDNFLVDTERAMEICKGIRRIGEIPFSFSGRVNSILSITDEQLLEMKECGLTSIEIGVENFNSNVLKRYKKNNTVEQIKNALRKLERTGVKPMIDFIMFDPWTTLEELRVNYQAIVELGLDSFDPPFLTNRLYPYPGTMFYNQKLIDMKAYFMDDKVAKVYSSMSRYMRQHKEYRNYLSKTKPRRYLVEAFFRLPYKVFDCLIKNPNLSLEEMLVIQTFEKKCFPDKSDPK